MRITYWGVRGTIATPGSTTVRYGGNTSCVSVEIDNTVLVLDTGTGARQLGNHLFGTGKRIVIAFSHRHFDHISGFPYFSPIHDPEQTVMVTGVKKPNGDLWYPTEMLDGTYFPKRFNEIASHVDLIDHRAFDWVGEFNFNFETFPVCHPGGAVGFRITAGDSVFVHVPDNELGCSQSVDARLESECRGATVLSHDAQYSIDEMTEKTGWGHSAFRRTCNLARRADVGRLVLFHHDPSRTDDELDAIGSRLSLDYAPLDCVMAYEGLVLQI